MCGGVLAVLNPEEIIQGIITWEDNENDFRLHCCPPHLGLQDFLAIFKTPHRKYPHLVKGKIISPIIAQRKYIRKTIKRLRQKNQV